MAKSSRDLLDDARSTVSEVSPQQVRAAAGSRTLIDVRERSEFDEGYIPGAMHLSKGFIETRIEDSVPRRDTPITLYCAGGVRSLLAARALQELGYTNVQSMAGGYGAWKQAGFDFIVPRVLTAQQQQRYSRHLLIPEIGVEGQGKLLDARVLLIGRGGLGRPAPPKSDVRVREHNVVLSGENAREIFDQYDIIVNGCDNFPTRYLANDVAIFAKKPMVDGGIFRFEGQVTTVVPFQSPCYRCRYPSPPPPEEAPSCAEAAVLGVLPGIVGVLQATEVIKLITGTGDLLTGRLLHIDALAMKFREFRVPRDPQCPVCGENPTITEPIDYEGFCAAPSSVATEAAGAA